MVIESVNPSPVKIAGEDDERTEVLIVKHCSTYSADDTLQMFWVYSGSWASPATLVAAI